MRSLLNHVFLSAKLGDLLTDSGCVLMQMITFLSTAQSALYFEDVMDSMFIAFSLGAVVFLFLLCLHSGAFWRRVTHCSGSKGVEGSVCHWQSSGALQFQCQDCAVCCRSG